MAKTDLNTDKPLNEQEKLFVEKFMLFRQKAKAAREAGYTQHSDRQMGYEVFNRPHVKAYIEKLLEEQTITAAETLKIMSDMAEFDMADFFKPVKRIEYVKVKQPLAEAITEIELTIEKEKKFIDRAKLQGDELDAANKHIASLKRQITKHEIELESDPNAFHIVTRSELIETMELDVDAIVNHPSRGKIKSVKYTKDGIQLEGYDAKDAATQLLRVHGKFAKDNTITLVEQPLFPEPDAE